MSLSTTPQVMVVTSEGYFYQYNIDLENGGECVLLKQYRYVRYGAVLFSLMTFTNVVFWSLRMKALVLIENKIKCYTLFDTITLYFWIAKVWLCRNYRIFSVKKKIMMLYTVCCINMMSSYRLEYVLQETYKGPKLKTNRVIYSFFFSE